MKSRKEKIIIAARSLFSEKGYAATGLREICEKADVSLGNIYNHFKNKKDLFDHIFDPEKIVASISDTLSMLSADFPMNIDILILSIKKTIDSNRELFKLIFIDLIEFEGKNTDRMIEFFIKTGKRIFKKQLDDQSRTGKLKNLDYEFFIRFFVISIISYFVSTHTLPSFKKNPYSDVHIARMISDVTLTGISK